MKRSEGSDRGSQPGAIEVSGHESSSSVGFGDAFRLLYPYRRSLGFALLIGVAAAVASAVQPLVVSHIVNEFDGQLPRIYVTALITLLITGALLTAIRELIIERTGEQFAYETRIALIDHLYALPIATLDGRERADLVTRVTSDVSETRQFLTSGFVDLAVSVFSVIISLVMMALIDIRLLALSTAAVVSVLITVLLLGRRTRPAGLLMQDSLGALAECVSRALGGIRTVRATRATSRELNRATLRANNVRQAGFIAARLRAIVQTLSAVSVQIVLIVVVGVGALRVSAGQLTTGDLSAFTMYLMMLISPVVLVGSVIASLGEAFGSLSRIREIYQLSREAEIVEDHQVLTEPLPNQPILSFRDVSFTYPSQLEKRHSNWSLDEITFEVFHGETVAFVGPSGSGRSTIFSLLERFYDPTSGKICFGGRDVMRMSREYLRSKIAYVDQDAVVLQGTVAENLRLGNDDLTDQECLAALVAVNLVGANDESGYEYLRQDIGELGRGFSGGQRQRIAIARCLLWDAQVLLLDEATSNLDSNSESLVQDAIELRATNRTTLVIAHRLSTVLAADRIFVIDEGKIQAQGTHSQLLVCCPLYRDLASHQFLEIARSQPST